MWFQPLDRETFPLERNAAGADRQLLDEGAAVRADLSFDIVTFAPITVFEILPVVSRFTLFRRWAAVAALVVHALPPGRAAEPVDDENVVALPPFLVEEAGKGPPWRYAQMPGFEVLSRCNDAMTQNFAAAQFRLHQLLALMLPERLQIRFAVPMAIILYDAKLQPASSQEVLSGLLNSRPKDAPPAVETIRGARFQAITRRYSFVPNMRLWDRDSMSVFAILEEGSMDSEQLALSADYVAYLMRNRAPALPAWFIVGMQNLYRQVDFRDGELTIRAGPWISEAETQAVKKDPKTARAPLPLAALFNGPVPDRAADGGELLRLWSSEAALLVRWALDDKTAARRNALWTFVERSTFEPPTEALFRACFGTDFATAGQQLAAYLPTAVRRNVVLRPEHAIRPPALGLRNATEAEIARIRGDWERLEVGFVKLRLPELAPKYREQARRTLLRAYDHDARDPAMLAILGLCECDAGNDGAAANYLESAVAVSGLVRPRAWFELARIRFAGRQAHPEGADGKLSARQATEVLTPLFTARAQTPAMVEVYELIAEVWQNCAVTPTRAHLAVLDEGVRLFPRSVELVYRAAVLNARHGFAKEAAALIELGRAIAPDDATRERFAQVQAQLPVGAPPTLRD